MMRPVRFRERINMAKIKVVKSGKETAKPKNFCPWVIDND
jgi:hypothetical protein